MRTKVLPVLLALVVVAPLTASAGDEPLPETLVERSQSCTVTVCFPGRYEFHYIHAADFAVDAEGHPHGVVDYGVQRWRIKPRVTFAPKLFVELEADLLTGQVFGDVTTGPQDFLIEPTHETSAFDAPSAATLRALYLSWQSPIGLFRIGHQTSHYGYGLVANGGDDEDHSVFDSPRVGDIVERFLYATKPFVFLDNDFGNAFVLAGGFDVVFRDDNANLLDGDFAMQGVVSVNYRTRPLTAGIYMAFRDQEDEDGDTLDAQAYDLFVEWNSDLSSDMRLSVGAEVALINASTDRLNNSAAPHGVDVLSLGAVGRVRLELTDLGIEARLEAGYASGDNDLNDGTVRRFSFDPGYQVGMVLFPLVLNRISARTVDRARDEELQAEPRKGVELAGTDGKINNAIYVNPVFRWKSTFGLGVDLGVLLAWSDGAFTDPFRSNFDEKGGGFNMNYLGTTLDGSPRFYGTEIDGGLHYTLDVKSAVAFRLGAQAGVLLPGDAFEAPDGTQSLGTVFQVRSNFEVRF